MKKTSFMMPEATIKMLEDIATELYINKSDVLRLLIQREYNKELQKHIEDLRILNNELLEKNKILREQLNNK